MSALDRYLVRAFDPERDLAGAYDAFVSGFHHILWPLIDHADRRLVEDIILTASRAAVSTYVAEADGEARGILVGGLPFMPSQVAQEAALMSSFLLRWYAGPCRRLARPLALACLRRVLLGYMPFVFLHPMRPSSETLMLTSQGEYRGGIGKVMMDAWVDESRRMGCRRTTVCTDTELSWDFYERYGFTRVREFNLKAYAYSMPDCDPTGYIYSLDVPGTPAA